MEKDKKILNNLVWLPIIIVLAILSVLFWLDSGGDNLFYILATISFILVGSFLFLLSWFIKNKRGDENKNKLLSKLIVTLLVVLMILMIAIFGTYLVDR